MLFKVVVVMRTGRPVNTTNPIRSSGRNLGWFGPLDRFGFVNGKSDEYGLGTGSGNIKLDESLLESSI